MNPDPVAPSACRLDVAGLLKALNDSLDFERELTERFGGPRADVQAAAAEADMGSLDEQIREQARAPGAAC